MKTGKTSTFTIHHDTCDPSKWTAHDVLALAAFIRSGDIRHAGTLAHLGMQLVLSEHHVPVGGTLEHIGWSTLKDSMDGVISDLEIITGDAGTLEVCEVVRIYRGQPEYAVSFAVGSHDEIDGHETEIKPTEAEAHQFVQDLQDEFERQQAAVPALSEKE